LSKNKFETFLTRCKIGKGEYPLICRNTGVRLTRFTKFITGELEPSSDEKLCLAGYFDKEINELF